ncbi:hypothetical protein FPZ24_08975 [Sphingomonas panacisoli]|uniref:Uncharacterized protein n=1 Tax=Sphingomonas panacisoli TaxID=1813879 RepID=A0A5B8LII3_9SPHN|nr:hypothetical protein [Sphingomonas panacisoli]QDZ07605.1 hypothetical protein FPZ24_08975 [Sphingomonas panacisoli]
MLRVIHPEQGALGMANVILKSALVLIGCLIAGDIAGVLFLVFVEVLPFELFSTPLTYVVWFVFGIFVGLSAYGVAGEWSSPKRDGGDWFALPQAKQTGWVIVATQTVVLVALGYAFHRLYWSQGVAGEYYVPDSAPHSITYAVAVLGAVIAARSMFTPTPTEI